MADQLRDSFGAFGEPVSDASEETFLLFSRQIPSEDLGMVDRHATSLDLTVAGRDITVLQSPGLLKSDRREGTTGAVVWKVSPLFADWIASESNVLSSFALSRTSSVLELGCGIGGVVGLALAPRVAHYMLTDQEYVMRILKQNIAGNFARAPKGSDPKKKVPTESKRPVHAAERQSNVDAFPLDWETSSMQHLPSFLGGLTSTIGVDMVLSCDCVFNESLTTPFAKCCASICRLRIETALKPSICIIAQQLRSDLVFEQWLTAMLEDFDVWRLHDDTLSNELRANPGFVVHVAMLKTAS